MRESATKRYKAFQIPVEWMLDSGIVSQVNSPSLSKLNKNSLILVV